MSTPELPAPITQGPLTTQQKTLSDAILGNPLEYPDGFLAYMEQFIRLRLPTETWFQVFAQKMAYPVGFPRIVMEDLTANTSEYVWTDPITGLGYLYCNGAAVSQTTYADLYAQWGASKWAADSGGNFSLPDTRGRGLLLCGTHADVDLGDTFGPATESSRRGNTHGHARTSLTVTNANESAHTHGAGTYTNPHKGSDVAKADPGAGASIGVVTTITTEAITGTSGAGSAHTHTATVGGTIGTDTNEGGSGIVIGSLVVRY